MDTLGFEYISLACLGVVAFALLRGRPSAFFAGINLWFVSLALEKIDRFGQPRSQGFLPAYLFSGSHVEIARNCLLISLAALIAVQLLPEQRALLFNGPQEAYPPLPKRVVQLSVVIIIIQTFLVKPIWQVQYATQSQMVLGTGVSGGTHALIATLLIYHLYRRFRLGEISGGKGFALVFLMFFATDFSKGSTGFGAGFVTVAAFLFLVVRPLTLKRILVSASAVLAVATLVLSIRTVRSVLHEEGSAALTSLVDDESTVPARDDEEGLEGRFNGTQYAAHMVECIDLYERGISREWASLYRPIEYTFKPSPLLKLLDIERSREAAWELGDHFIHGGGIFLIGELYWNGGYLCVLVGSLFFFVVGRLADTRYAQSAFWLLMLCSFGSTFLMGFGYGVAQVMRGIINVLLISVLYLLVARPRYLGRLRTASNSETPSSITPQCPLLP